MKNKDLLFDNIKKAMESNPGLSLLETIEHVCDLTFATRKYFFTNILELDPESNKWKLTDSDLLYAFEKYNKMRLSSVEQCNL